MYTCGITSARNPSFCCRMLSAAGTGGWCASALLTRESCWCSAGLAACEWQGVVPVNPLHWRGSQGPRCLLGGAAQLQLGRAGIWTWADLSICHAGLERLLGPWVSTLARWAM